MVRKPFERIEKVFVKYGSESRSELDELKKVRIMAIAGSTKKQKIFISIDKPKVIEVRVYNLGNYSIGTYNDFNKKVKKLFQ